MFKFSALNLQSYGLCGFNKYEHFRKYRRQEFENVLEKILCICFRQLLRIYTKNIEHYEVYISAQKMDFPLRISSVNVTKYAVSHGFGLIYEKNP